MDAMTSLKKEWDDAYNKLQFYQHMLEYHCEEMQPGEEGFSDMIREKMEKLNEKLDKIQDKKIAMEALDTADLRDMQRQWLQQVAEENHKLAQMSPFDAAD